MIAGKTHIQSVRPVLKNNSQIQITPALKKFAAQLANADATVRVGASEDRAQVA